MYDSYYYRSTVQAEETHRVAEPTHYLLLATVVTSSKSHRVAEPWQLLQQRSPHVGEREVADEAHRDSCGNGGARDEERGPAGSSSG